MAYIGNTVQTQGFAPAVDYFNGDGVTVTFTLSRPVASVAQLTAVIDNVIQNPSSAFTVSGNSITFTSAPLAGTNNIWVEYTSLVTTYAAISQDPSVIGDITATGGYLAEGDFGNSYIDGTIVDYVTGNARITTGPSDGLTIYNGGTTARTALAAWSTTGVLTNTGGAVIEGLTVGKGAGGGSYNSAFGVNTLASNTSDGNNALGWSSQTSTSTGTYNASFGTSSMYSNTSGSYNVAFGGQALRNNTTASNNTAVGYQAGYSNTTGTNNVAVGRGALYAASTADYNTAVGDRAANSTTGNANSAFGGLALYSNTSGSRNTAIGEEALQANTTTSNNTAVGYQAGYLGTRTSTVAVGYNALSAAGSGSYQVAVGYNASSAVTSGDYNVCVGYNAGRYITTGSSNMCIGIDSGTDAVANLTTQNYRIAMGDNSVTNAYIKVSWTVTSDARDKTNINAIAHGLDFVSKLNPVSYVFKKSREDDTPHGNKRYGFLAQEILELEGDDPVIIDTENEENLKYNGEALVPVLVKAIQEQQAMIEELKTKVAALEAK